MLVLCYTLGVLPPYFYTAYIVFGGVFSCLTSSIPAYVFNSFQQKYTDVDYRVA